MSDDLKNRGGSDRSRINLNQDYERRDSGQKNLGVTEDELREAVEKVGDRAERVRAYLKSRASRN